MKILPPIEIEQTSDTKRNTLKSMKESRNSRSSFKKHQNRSNYTKLEIREKLSKSYPLMIRKSKGKKAMMEQRL